MYESGHPCCKAPIGKVVDKNQETKINNLFVSDASFFPSPLGLPPILTIVALSKKLSKYLLANTWCLKLVSFFTSGSLFQS